MRNSFRNLQEEITSNESCTLAIDYLKYEKETWAVAFGPLYSMSSVYPFLNDFEGLNHLRGENTIGCNTNVFLRGCHIFFFRFREKKSQSFDCRRFVGTYSAHHLASKAVQRERIKILKIATSNRIVFVLYDLRIVHVSVQHRASLCPFYSQFPSH